MPMGQQTHAMCMLQLNCQAVCKGCMSLLPVQSFEAPAWLHVFHHVHKLRLPPQWQADAREEQSPVLPLCCSARWACIISFLATHLPA